jgi:hypothetical protein
MQQAHATALLVGPNILLSTLFSDTFNLCSSLTDSVNPAVNQSISQSINQVVSLAANYEHRTRLLQLNGNKVKVKGKVIPVLLIEHHIMNAYGGSGGIAPYIL